MEFNLLFCLVAVAILMLCILVFIKLYRKLKMQYEDLQESCHNLEQLNMNLRAQRHDYLNHLQVVYGMMELEEYQELENYLRPLYRDMMKTGKALKTSNPALNALLQAKMGEAESKKIDFFVEVKSDLMNLKIEAWELCKVISNLCDNAMTALEDKEGERKIWLDINEDRNFYIFSVSNNGPQIPQEQKNNIFKPGFSTKNGEGHGMGLYIVASVLKEYKGSIDLNSNEEETVFTVKFQKEQKNHG